jgi:hypothetical protein
MELVERGLKEVKRQEENVLNVIAEEIGEMESGILIMVQFNVFCVATVVSGLAINLI